MLQKLVLNFVNFIGKTPKIGKAFCPKMRKLPQNYPYRIFLKTLSNHSKNG